MKAKIILIILVLAIAGAAFYFIRERRLSENDDAFYGTVEATEIKLSAEVPGKVLEMTVDEGDQVEKGSVLVRIDHELLNAQLAQAEAAKISASGQYRALNINIKNLGTNVTRSKNLLGAGSISEQQFEAVDTQKKSLTAQRSAAYGLIKQAEATTDLVKTQIDRATVIAPISGVVLQKSVEPGEMVMPGSTLMTLGDLENCWVRIFVPETDLGRVKLV